MNIFAEVSAGLKLLGDLNSLAQDIREGKNPTDVPADGGFSDAQKFATDLFNILTNSFGLPTTDTTLNEFEGLVAGGFNLFVIAKQALEHK